MSPISKRNYNTNIISKYRGGFPERQTPMVLDTLCNAEYNIKYLKKNNIQHYRSTLMDIRLCTNVINKILLIIPNIKSKHSNNTHVRLPGYIVL